MTGKLHSYHFGLGNSTDGPVGCCARVLATSKVKAVELLKAALPDTVEVRPVGDDDTNERIEYLHVYLNERAISEADIDEIDD
jgi:hypothetical protein